MSRSPVLRCLRSSSLAMQYSGYASRRVFGVVCKGRKENMTATSRDCFSHVQNGNVRTCSRNWLSFSTSATFDSLVMLSSWFGHDLSGGRS